MTIKKREKNDTFVELECGHAEDLYIWNSSKYETSDDGRNKIIIILPDADRQVRNWAWTQMIMF